MLRKYQKEITYCTFCPKLCRFSCPVTNAEARETVTPTNKMVFLNLIEKGAIDQTEEESELFFHCLGCRLCRAYCKHRIDVGEVMLAARAEAVKKDNLPAPVKEMLNIYRVHNNPVGPALNDKLNSLRQERRINKTAPTIFFAGVDMLEHYPNAAKNTIKLLETCETDFAIFGGPVLSSGAPALMAGDHDLLGTTAKHVAEILNNYETVVCASPEALHIMKEYYPKMGATLKPRLLHTTEWLLEQMQNGRLKFGPRTEERIMYHDPCYMSKYLNIMDAPRALLEKMFFPERIIEFSWNRDKNYCCGGGGLYDLVAPDKAMLVAQERLREFYEAGPDMLVTACASCMHSFEKADPSVKVADIASLVLEHLDM